jgi:hypothetical protein
MLDGTLQVSLEASRWVTVGMLDYDRNARAYMPSRWVAIEGVVGSGPITQTLLLDGEPAVCGEW